MKKILVGNSGFVGSNLEEQIDFDHKFNSKNISQSYNLCPNILIYAGVPGNKTMANKSPDLDFEIIKNTINNITNINAKKLILISTIDVYSLPQNIDETFKPNPDCAYGKHRVYLENWVIENVKDYHILRLPAIYGKNLKKNLIYDIIHPVPPFLDEKTYNKFTKLTNIIKDAYKINESGFYALSEQSKNKMSELERFFKAQNFSTLNFTDSRAIFQFFNLKYLKKIIEVVVENNIKILNVATEPISTKELLKNILNENFENEIKNDYQNYNFKTKYSKYFGRSDGYIFSKNEVLSDLNNYIKRAKEDERIR